MKMLPFFMACGMLGAVYEPASGNAVTVTPTLQASAHIGPRVGGTTFTVGSGISGPSTVYFGNNPGTPTSFGNAEGTGLVSGSGKFDPFISFAASVIDLGAPSQFEFIFLVPLSPILTGPVATHATLGITITASPDGPASIAADLFPPTIMVSNIGTCAAGVDVGAGFSTPTSTTTVRSFDATGTFTPTAGCDSYMLVDVSFTGTGNSAAYSLTGLFEIVPEPASAMILGTAILGLARLRKGKKSLTV